jgi:hypothetical protein
MNIPTPPEPPKPPQYMSYIPGRANKFKAHEKKGHLTNALSAYIDRHAGGKVGSDMYAYELKGDRYEVMWHIAAGTSNEELPWSKRIYQPYTPPHVQCKCPNCK